MAQMGKYRSGHREELARHYTWARQRGLHKIKGAYSDVLSTNFLRSWSTTEEANASTQKQTHWRRTGCTLLETFSEGVIDDDAALIGESPSAETEAGGNPSA